MGQGDAELKAHVNEVLKRIGDGQGLSDLCLDGNNHCMLLFDEKIVLNMDLDEAGKLLVIYAYIGEVPIECRDAVYQKALEGNFFGTKRKAVRSGSINNRSRWCWRARSNCR